MKLKSDQKISVGQAKHEANDRHTVEHGAVLEHGHVHRVVHVVGVRDDIFLVRSFCQTLRLGWLEISGRGHVIGNSP